MAKLQVFLSHITVESKLADILGSHLAHDFIGLVDVFESSDRLSVPAGKKWLSEVTAALKRADLHLILCSQEAISRPWIQFEAGAAHLRGIPIVPLCHSGLGGAQLTVPLSENEAIKISDPQGLRALYRAIAETLGSDVPEIDFEEFARQVVSFEAEYVKQRALIGMESDLKGDFQRIRDPKALCISSPQFAQLGFENQLQVVLNAFPAVIPHQRVFSSSELRQAVGDDGGFDVAHIAAFVCPRSGDVYFSEVDLHSGASTAAERDVLTADALASLLELAGVKLVVIGSCDSIALGATLTSTCHVIAARDMVSARMMASWVDAFYSKLPQTSLTQALSYAQKVSQAPMRFYARQSSKVDLFFLQDTDRAHTLVGSSIV